MKMRYPKLRELREAIKALIKGPYTSRFPYEAHTPYERFRGRPHFHDEHCIGCTACAQVCPAQAIEVEDTLHKRVLTVHWDICVFCGQCQANCPTEKGIMLSQEFALATTEKREDLKETIEKEFILCECCAEPVVPYEQFLWVTKRLGPLCFSNSSLMFFYLRILNLASKEKPALKEELEFNRSDSIKIICPNCRREAVTKS